MVQPAIPAVPAVAGVSAAARVVAVGDQGRDVLARFDRIAQGAKLEAKLQSRFEDGSFEVALAGTSLRMRLPEGLRVGQQIELTLLNGRPRPTFLLQQDQASASAQLSPAGRLLNALLQTQGKEGPAQALLRATEPALPAAPDDAGSLAQGLRNALTQSGLFYEAHVEQWARGGRSLAELQREPQYRYGPAQLQGETEKGAAPAAQRPRPASEGSAARAPDDLWPAEGVTRQGANAAAQAPAGGSGLELAIAPDSQAAQMLRVQLEALEHRQVLWQGQAWPGLPMEWGIAEGDGGQASAEGERSWQSVVRFHFPGLGTVAATLRLDGKQLQVALEADSDQAAARLRSDAGSLTEALAAAGTPLSLMTVRRGEPK